jgi:hypothetical protein
MLFFSRASSLGRISSKWLAAIGSSSERGLCSSLLCRMGLTLFFFFFLDSSCYNVKNKEMNKNKHKIIAFLHCFRYELVISNT